MTQLSLRIDEPKEILRQLGEARSQRVSIAIPVDIGGQDPRDAAESIRKAIFICEELSKGLTSASVSVTRDPRDPNGDLVLLAGVAADVDVILEFVNDWQDTLDPDGVGEPFELTSATIDGLHDLLEGDEEPGLFRFPSLVEWYREVRSRFDHWDPDADFAE